MNAFFEAACLQVFFFDGKILANDLDFIRKEFEKFRIIPLQRIRNRPWVKNLIDEIPDLFTYDLYHKEVQAKDIERLFEKESPKNILNSLKSSLFFDGFGKAQHFEELKLKAINFFGIEQIEIAVNDIKKETRIVNNSYFHPTEFRNLLWEITEKKEKPFVFRIQDRSIRKRICISDWKMLKKTGKKSNSLLIKNSNSSIKLKCQNQLRLQPSDLQNFVNQIPHFIAKRLTLRQMFAEFRKTSITIQKISFSSFYKRFVLNQKLVYRKSKICHSHVNQEKKKIQRKLNCFLIERILSSQQIFYFYDETTIDSKMCFSKAWSLKETKPIQFVKAPISFFKLNIVCSLTEIIAFSLTTENFSTDRVADFLQSSAELIKRRTKDHHPVLLMLDNGPKNRSEKCIRLAKKNHVRFVYTTPTTPQHNFCECLFQVIKSKISKFSRFETDSIHGLTEKEIFDLIIQSLIKLRVEDFGGARRSYFHELKSCL